jgi:hypothetical protein
LDRLRDAEAMGFIILVGSDYGATNAHRYRVGKPSKDHETELRAQPDGNVFPKPEEVAYENEFASVPLGTISQSQQHSDERKKDIGDNGDSPETENCCDREIVPRGRSKTRFRTRLPETRKKTGNRFHHQGRIRI